MKGRGVALGLLCVVLTGCAGTAESAQVQFFAMDTLMSVTVYGRQGGQAARAVQAEMNRLDALWSRTREDSDISRLNAGAGSGTAVEVDADTGVLLERANTAARESGGAFNPVMAPVMDAWGFTGEEHRVPGGEELEALLPLTLTLPWVASDGEEGGTRAALTQAGQAVDAGAIAKGRAADLAREVLADYTVTGAILDLGGNITVLGEKPDGAPFRVAVKDPGNTEELLCVLTLEEGTCSTSGGYERYFEADGVRYHHILDPADGCPAESGLRSVTAVSTDGTWADAYSTACFVMGAEKALDFWRTGTEAAQTLELVLVGEDGRVYVTEGLAEGFEFRGEEKGYTYEIVYR